MKQILSLFHVHFYRNFENYVFELETNANQHFKASKIVEYLEIVKKKDFEASISYFIYVIAARLIFEFLHPKVKNFDFQGQVFTAPQRVLHSQKRQR